MRVLNLALIAIAAWLLSGCATAPEWLTNRVACTAAGDEAMGISMWGRIGIASVVDKRDAARICERR